MPPDPNALVKRDARGRLMAGTSSPNPKGRPRTGLALAETIREVAGDPAALRDLIRLALDVAFGRPVSIDTEYLRKRALARANGQPDPVREGEVMQPTIAEMQRAWEFLATWGFRKPPQEVEVSTGGAQLPFDYERLSEAELDQLEALHAKAAGVLEG